NVPAVEPANRCDQPVKAGRLLQIGLSVEECGQAPFTCIEHPLRVLRCASFVTTHQVARAKLEEEQKAEREKGGEGNKTREQGRRAPIRDTQPNEDTDHAASRWVVGVDGGCACASGVCANF